jgi:hypothetical protein
VLFNPQLKSWSFYTVAVLTPKLDRQRLASARHGAQFLIGRLGRMEVTRAADHDHGAIAVFVFSRINPDRSLVQVALLALWAQKQNIIAVGLKNRFFHRLISLFDGDSIGKGTGTQLVG